MRALPEQTFDEPFGSSATRLCPKTHAHHIAILVKRSIYLEGVATASLEFVL